MKYIISLIVCAFSFNFIEGQNKNAEPFSSYQQAYDEYFKIPRESLYLHLNKSSYLRGENIWFQGYAYNRKTNTLNSSTRNVELGIYDGEGKIIDKKLFLAKDGLFSGQIAIDSTYADGNYYLKAETNYMKNFKENYAHIQQFEILGEKFNSESQTVKNYDLQILPEGGHSVINCSSNLGIKLINSNGAGIKFVGKLFEDNTSIMDFKSNQFGLAKVKILPKANRIYHVEVTLPNGKTVKQIVENIKPHGYVLNVNNQIPNKTIVQISSYLPKDHNYKETDVKLIVHQEGQKFIIPLYFSEDITKISKVITKKQLFRGVNTLTLFVNDTPVAERLVFNTKDLFNHSDDIDIVQEQPASKDSLSFEVSLPDLKTEANLSISVLPKETISYVKNQNISSAFLLEPFVHGYIENKSYYFKNPDRKVNYNLDLLLLTQGWSQYSWDNILSGPVQDIRPRANGLTQNITVKNKIRKDRELIVYNTIHNDGMGIKLRKDSIKEFQLYHRYPIVGETMQFFFNSEKENLIKPDLEVSTELQFQNDNLSKELLGYPLNNLRHIKPEISSEKLYDSFFNEQKLDTVFLSSKTKKQKNLRNDYVTSFKDNTLKVTEEVAATYNLLSDYLVTKGYIVVENAFASDRDKRFQIRNMYRTSINADQSPVVFLDGVRLTDLLVLSGARMSDFEEVVIDRSGYNMGVQGTNGVIRLERRRTPIFNEATASSVSPEDVIKYHTVQRGFEAPKQFYTPKFAFYKSETFKQVGTIAWFSNLSVPPNQSVNLQIPDTGLRDMTFYIEGIAEDGSLITIEKTVEQ